MYICIYINIYTYIHIYTHIRIYLHTYIYRVHASLNYAAARTQQSSHLLENLVHEHFEGNICHIYIHAYICLHIYVYVYIYTYVFIYIDIFTYILLHICRSKMCRFL
jgi:hypothetical protein